MIRKMTTFRTMYSCELPKDPQSWTSFGGLCACQITVVPPQISEMVNLTSLNLSGNSLSDLPDTLTALGQLKVLNIGWNCFRNFPSILCRLPCLLSLNMEYNQLRVLPDEIGNLAQLSRLSLAANNISTIPASIGCMKCLSDLSLLGNALETFPSCLYSLVSLSSLNLESNSIREFEGDSSNMSGLISLSSLILRQNCLQIFPEISLPKLEHLNLGENYLVDFPCTTGFPSLETLVLDCNSITTIPISIARSTTLTSLNLSFNELRSLPQLTGLSLRNIDIAGNLIPSMLPLPVPEDCFIENHSEEANEIIAGLFLGSAASAKCKALLQANRVTHIVSAIRTKRPLYPLSFRYLNVPVDDTDEDDILSYFPATMEFIDQARKAGSSVLVHCMAGMSRSATLVIAYIIFKFNCSVEKALSHTQQKRPIVWPNEGFIEQLNKWYLTLQAQQPYREILPAEGLI
ncbi:leucine rich repeat protein [Pelomyxa schiedti]|nr:leucine rich repeat protein [Pelomyxa schiedti]